MYWLFGQGAQMTSPRQRRASQQRANVQKAASGRPIQLRDAAFGATVPGGPAYGARLNGRQVLVQPGAAAAGALGTGFGREWNAAKGVNFGGQTLYPAELNGNVVWMPSRSSQPTQLERTYGAGAPGAAPAPRPSAPATRPAPAAPGLGAPTPITTGRGASRERMNEMSQNAGGANISERILPGEDAVKAAGAYAEARAKDPFAEIPALVDQRSQEHGQRADIAAWIEANKNAPKGADGMNIVDRFLAKQRRAEPGAMRPTDAGMERAYSGQIQVAPAAATLKDLPYGEGSMPAGVPAAFGSDGRGAAFTQEFGVGPAAAAPVYQGPAPDREPAGMANTTAAMQQAFGGELQVVPQATAQASNLNFNSPLPDANMSQAFSDETKTLSEDLLKRYKLGILGNQGFAFNAG